MKNCNSCGSDMAEKDRFCGICGKPATEAALQPPGLVQADRGVIHGKFSRMTILAIAIALVAVLLGGLLYSFAPWQVENSSDEPDAAIDQPASEDASQPALATTKVKPGLAASEGASASPPPEADMAIEPGRWRFTNELVNVSRVDPSDTRFVWEDEDIGDTSSNERCISERAARAPRQASFPMLPARRCRPTSFAMANGAYRARFQCEFKGNPNGSEAAVDGTYTRQDLHVMALVTRPADLGSDDPSYQPPQIVLHLKIDGEYLGPCR